MFKFSARVFKIGINPVVDPPEDVLSGIFEQAGKSKGAIPVSGRLNGADFIQTLVKYQGSWRLYVNGPMLKAAGIEVGDIARVEIEFDPEPREVVMPKGFAIAMQNDESARSAYEKLSPSRQKEILRYLGSLKTEESLDRNIKRVLRHLRGEDSPTLHGLMRLNKPG
jgi:hypothetical protein